MIDRLVGELAEVAEGNGFSGVALVQEEGRTVLEFVGGLANRSADIPMALDTRLATASVTKGFTALAVTSMIEDGLFGFDSRLVELVGELPHVDPSVTIEHLLGHTSGVGEYLDEDELDGPDEYVFDVPVHQLLGPENYVPILNRHKQRQPPGTKFVYNNSGYIWLALVVERIGVASYHDEVRRRVFEPAGLVATDFLRSDDLPGGVALGYLEDGRTNIFHLPVIGTGDGGAYTTASDMMRFWWALLAGDIVGSSLVDKMTAVANESSLGRYGLGFWIGADRTTVQLEGMDAGVSMFSGVNPTSGLSFCFIANNSSDVWPLVRVVNRYLEERARAT